MAYLGVVDLIRRFDGMNSIVSRLRVEAGASAEVVRHALANLLEREFIDVGAGMHPDYCHSADLDELARMVAEVNTADAPFVRMGAQLGAAVGVTTVYTALSIEEMLSDVEDRPGGILRAIAAVARGLDPHGTHSPRRLLRCV